MIKNTKEMWGQASPSNTPGGRGCEIEVFRRAYTDGEVYPPPLRLACR